MMSITRKELAQYFGNISGYIAIILFSLLTGIYLFLLPDSSILDGGFASLANFFTIAPWILALLVPAITMRIFPDEYRAGTFELLKTRPLSNWQISIGKYLAVLIIILVAIAPSVLYVFTIKALSSNHSIDGAGIIGSYIGLMLLAFAFAGISLCCSSFTQNAVIAFLLSSFICVLLYYGFTALSAIPALQGSADYYINLLGLNFHYQSISRGVIDTRDVIYFLSIIILSLFITAKNISRRTQKH